MAKIISIANQKGGVGKTTTSVNLSAFLAHNGLKTLIIDIDPQGNASSGLGIKRFEIEDSNIYHVLIGQKSLEDVIQKTSIKKLDIAPTTPDLVAAEIELIDLENREFRLKSSLKQIQNDYDYIIVDCPPSLGLLTLNAFTAAHSFLVPLQCEYYALEGVSQLLDIAGRVRQNLNPLLEMEGIVLTMFDTRNNLSHQVAEEVRGHFKDSVFKTVIPRNVKISEAPSHGRTLLEYAPHSVGAVRYNRLAQELNQKLIETQKKESNQTSQTLDNNATFVQPPYIQGDSHV